MDKRIAPILTTRSARRPAGSLLLAPALLLAAAATAATGSVEPALPDLAPPPAAAASAPVWEGALGLNVSRGGSYQGGGAVHTKLEPGFFLRYGRYTVTNASGYVTRRADDVYRGLGMDLSNTSRLRLNLGLRFDAGRNDSTDPALAGLGDIPPTVRARLAASERLDRGWRLAASWSIDAFGRGGGNFAEFGVSRELRWSPATVWGWGAGLSLGGTRYMQTYFGVSEEQAARTGYPVYKPGAGLRDASLFANLRSELSPQWVLLGSVSAARLLGPAARSPLTRRTLGWGFGGGLARRF